MPADFQIDVARRRVYSFGSGFLTRDDIVGHMNRLGRDPKFRPSFSQILDFRDVTDMSITAEDIVEFAQIRLFSPLSKRAFVTPEAVKFGMARMYEAYRVSEGDHMIRVFLDYKEAIDWLDLEEIPTPPQGKASPATQVP